jgi:hypothetical protein
LSVIERPMMLGSPPKRVIHAPCDSTATAAPLPCSVSSGVNSRPRSAVAPRIVRAFALTKLPISRSGASTPVRLTLCERTIDSASNVRLRARISTMSGSEMSVRFSCPSVPQITTSRSGSG